MSKNTDKNLKLLNLQKEEYETFFSIMKHWIVKYNGNELITCYSQNLHDVDTRQEFKRIKLFIDYFELIQKCKSVAKAISADFIRCTKFIKAITFKILMLTNKISADTLLFTDLILINYPFLLKNLNIRNISMLNTPEGKIVGFNKAYVIRVKPPSFLLWSKKIVYNCDCRNEKKFFQKFLNIYKLENKGRSSNFFENFCKHCKKSYYQDKNSDIFIECQEIVLQVETADNVIASNMITVYAYSDLINSVKEGDTITVVAYYKPPENNTYEKDFQFGNFVALNFNFYFLPTYLLNENKFIFKLENLFASDLEQQKDDAELLRSNKFKKQLTVNLFGVFLQNFISNHTLIKNSYNGFLFLSLDLSIIQRDYANKITKDYIVNNEHNVKPKIKERDDNHLLKSRTALFKTSLFDNTRKLNNEVSNAQFKKYFRLSRQSDFDKTSSDNMLIKSLNLFIFIDNQLDSSELVNRYSERHKGLINVIPFFYQNKFNKENFINYLISCNNGIVVVPDIEALSKSEIEIIANIMNMTFNIKLNITFWFFAVYRKVVNINKKNNLFDFKVKNFDNIINNCEIILNFSKSFNGQRGLELQSDEANEFRKNVFLQNFSLDNGNNEFDFGNLNNILKKGLNNQIIAKNFKVCEDDHFYKDDFSNSFSAIKLMEDYFIIKRNLNNVNFNDLLSLIRIATFFSIMRSNYNNEEIVYPKTISNVNYLDVFLSILYYEESSMFKYGLESSCFGNTVGKIFLSNYTNKFVNIINDIAVNNKIKNSIAIQPGIPRTKTKTRVTTIGNDLSEDYGLKKDECKKCPQCSRFLELDITDKIEDFLEKFTIFVYNN
jgi:hypothetical protein